MRVCLNYMLNRKGRGVFKIYVEPELPNEGASLRYMLNRNRLSPMRGLEPESPNRGRV